MSASCLCRCLVRARPCYGLAVLVGALTSCTSPTDEERAPLTVQSQQVASSEDVSGQLRDVPELEVGLPERPGQGPWEASDSLLVSQLAAVDGEGFIGLKAPQNPRTWERPSLRQVEEPSRRLVKVGRRAAVTASEARAGLDALRRLGVTILRYYDAIAAAHVRLPPAAAPLLRNHPNVDYLEPLVDAAEPDVKKWWAENPLILSSQTTPANIDSVRAPLAWPYSTGTGARLLFIDTGHERGHEDLPLVPVGNCSFGLRNGCDDEQLNLEHHGTPVSGVAIALNNAVGVVGVAHSVPPSNVFFWGVCDTICLTAEITAALNWSVSNLGANGVINMSFSVSVYQLTVATGVAAALNAGHVLVASAGNTGQQQTRYPAAYPDVIGVAGILPNRTLASGSTWGQHVDFVAPWIAYTTYPGNGYITLPGNSFSTPHVTGLVALIRTRYPGISRSTVSASLTYDADLRIVSSREQDGTEWYRYTFSPEGFIADTGEVAVVGASLRVRAANDELDLLRLPLTVGTSWSTAGAVATIQARYDSYTIASGTYVDAIKVSYELDGDVVLELIFARDVGIISVVDQDLLGGTHFWNLKEYAPGFPVTRSSGGRANSTI